MQIKTLIGLFSLAALAASSPGLSVLAQHESVRTSVAHSLPKTGESSTLVSSTKCKINCVQPHAECAESEKVIETIKLMYKASSERDAETIAKFLDDNCTTIDEQTNKLVVGKAAVLDDIKRKWALFEESDSPLESYTIDNPYANVEGDTAIVTFRVLKEFGGKHPHCAESRCTDIFKKEGDKWVSLHHRTVWKSKTT